MEKEYKKIVVTGDRFVLQLSNQGLLKYFCKHEEKGLCEKYDEMLFAYRVGDLTVGRAILGPFSSVNFDF